MSWCVLFDHRFERLPGVGQFAGREFLVCSECGKTEEIGAVTDLHMGRTHTAFNARDAAPVPSPEILAEPSVKPRHRVTMQGQIAGTCFDRTAGEGEV